MVSGAAMAQDPSPRSATVIATSPVELLTINWKMVKRMQWLYPPTAHRFFFNLMGIVCDRLENLTECFAEIKMRADTLEQGPETKIV